MPSHIDAEQVARFNEGDEQAFQQLFETLYKPLCFFAEKLIGQKEESEDLASLAFHKLWLRSLTFDSVQSIRSYLYTTVKNLCFDQLKHRGVVNAAQKQLLASQDEAESYIESKIIQAELLQLIYQEIEQLPLQYKTIIRMSYLEDLSTSEIAGKLKLSESHVRANKSRAISLLKALFRKKRLVSVLLLIQTLG